MRPLAHVKRDGLGRQDQFDESLIVIDEKLSVYDGAIIPWARSSNPYYRQTVEALSKHYNFNPNVLGGTLMKKLKKFYYMVMKERKSTLDLMMEGEFIILKNHLKGVISNLKVDLMKLLNLGY